MVEFVEGVQATPDAWGLGELTLLPVIGVDNPIRTVGMLHLPTVPASPVIGKGGEGPVVARQGLFTLTG